MSNKCLLDKQVYGGYNMIMENELHADGRIYMEQVTPMMQKYLETKEEYKDCILFYRLGDFYEMFFEDAKLVSKELEITLTGKSCGLEERAPMCGVPYHAVSTYLNRLVEKGYKVAICEQVEDPKLAKGLVKREVVRIVTPGTNLDTDSMDESRNNYLMCIVSTTDLFGIATVDITTGDFYVTEITEASKVLDEINKYMPSEIICNEAFFICGLDIEELRNRLSISISGLPAHYFDEHVCEQMILDHFKVKSLMGLGLDEYSIGNTSAGAILNYLYETQKNDLSHMTTITPYQLSTFMVLDRATRRNLELVETMREKNKKGSLLGVLDRTGTALGARMLRQAIEQPLIDQNKINERLDAVEELNENAITREECREYLRPIYDLERLISRISYHTANPRDMVAFASSLSMLPHIKNILEGFSSSLIANLRDTLDPLKDICQLILQSINEEPPILIREGGIIKEGYHQEVDQLRHAKTDGKTWLSELEERERNKTGIKNLRVKYNKVFGYYLEVTNSYKDLVPEEWTRKQTLANAERYTTTELKELEDIILGAEDKLNSLEYYLFDEIRTKVSNEVRRIQKTAKIIANIDMLCSMAYVSEKNHYVRPVIASDGAINIKNGRHPVIEQMISNDLFVPNDTYLDAKNDRIAIITGPNMAGKSTYMRQVALIVLMAQIGCFVPCDEASIGIVDRIFTRVGASDDLASGQSTFMVEMTEVANILRNATKNSLIILDEIGRGTSTFDGLSIAWAVVEHIDDRKLLGAKTLFATHYHELTELEGTLKGVKNYCIAVREQGEDIVFLRKIVRGGADRSYGIQVAKLAGVPQSVLKRAYEIAALLEEENISHPKEKIEEREKMVITDEMDQLSIFDAAPPSAKSDDILLELHDLSVDKMTPIDALMRISEWQKKLKGRW